MSGPAPGLGHNQAPETLFSLDQSTCTGYCFGVVGEKPRWGSIRFEAAPTRLGINAQFRDWLVRSLTDIRPSRMVFETPYIPMPRKPRFAAAGSADFFQGPPSGGSPIMMNALTLRRLLYMAECIIEVCDRMDVRCVEVTTSEVMKFLGVQGRLKRDRKKAETLRIIRGMGFPVGDDNAGDAVAMWLMFEAKVAPALAARRGFGTLFAAQA